MRPNCGFLVNPGVILSFVQARSVLYGAIFIVALSALPSLAATVSGLDRDKFAYEISDGETKTETFDSLAVGPLPEIAGLEITTSGTGTLVITHKFYASTGTGSLGAGSIEYFLPAEVLTFTFDSEITAFAIDINTFATTDGAFVATLDNGESYSSVFSAFTPVNTGQFLAFTSSTPFRSVSISTTSKQTYTVDTVVYGDDTKEEEPPPPDIAPVPLPAPILMLLAALGGLLLLRRRRV
jgi:hypothetical protein